MSIISNTTVLSNFASIGQLDVLHRLYQQAQQLLICHGPQLRLIIFR